MVDDTFRRFLMTGPAILSVKVGSKVAARSVSLATATAARTTRALQTGQPAMVATVAQETVAASAAAPTVPKPVIRHVVVSGNAVTPVDAPAYATPVQVLKRAAVQREEAAKLAVQKQAAEKVAAGAGASTGASASASGSAKVGARKAPAAAGDAGGSFQRILMGVVVGGIAVVGLRERITTVFEDPLRVGLGVRAQRHEEPGMSLRKSDLGISGAHASLVSSGRSAVNDAGSEAKSTWNGFWYAVDDKVQAHFRNEASRT